MEVRFVSLAVTRADGVTVIGSRGEAVSVDGQLKMMLPADRLLDLSACLSEED